MFWWHNRRFGHNNIAPKERDSSQIRPALSRFGMTLDTTSLFLVFDGLCFMQDYLDLQYMKQSVDKLPLTEHLTDIYTSLLQLDQQLQELGSEQRYLQHVRFHVPYDHQAGLETVTL